MHNDLGNLLLAFLMVFGYFSFSQFLIIWSGNLPNEITWYLRRLSGGWQWLAIAVVLLGFIAFFRCSRAIGSGRPDRWPDCSDCAVAVYAIHTYWMIVPAFARPVRHGS